MIAAILGLLLMFAAVSALPFVMRFAFLPILAAPASPAAWSEPPAEEYIVTARQVLDDLPPDIRAALEDGAQ